LSELVKARRNVVTFHSSKIDTIKNHHANS
jgi:hypothetical protein